MIDTIIVLLVLAIPFWVCWRWFLRDWVNSLSITQSLKGKFFAHQISDEVYYAQAAQEVKNSIISEGLWAKAWSDANGEDIKAQALYIKYRVEDLRRQAAGKFSEYAKESVVDDARIIIQCEYCSANLRVAAGKHIDVHCPKCGRSFRTITQLPSFHSAYGSNFARYIYAVLACTVIVGVFLVVLGIAGDILRPMLFGGLEKTIIKTAILAGMVWSCVAAWRAIVDRRG